MTCSSYTIGFEPMIPFLVGNYPTDEDRRSKGGQPIVVKKTPAIEALKNVVENYKDNIAPPEFQRPESWTLKEKIAFFNSLLMDRVEGVLVLVCLEDALYSLRTIAPDDRAFRLFEKLTEQGYKYVVLDGNNRLQFLLTLFNNTFGIPEGEYEYIRSEKDTSVSKFKVRRNKNTFSHLPSAVQNTLLNRRCVISEYTQIGYDGLSSVFINTNSGVFPNRQELRNALNSPWADYVRALRSNVPELLGRIFSNFKKRYVGDDWIVECLDFAIGAVTELDEEVPFEGKLFNGEKDENGNRILETYITDVEISPINQSTKDNLYNSNFLSDQEQVGYLEVFKTLSEYVIEMIAEVDDSDMESVEKTKEIKRLTTKVNLMNLYWMMCHGVDTYEQARLAVELHKESYANSVRCYGEDEATFKNACQGSRKANLEFRYIVLTEIVKEVVKQTTLSEVNF
jgi:hypothetical protein